MSRSALVFELVLVLLSLLFAPLLVQGFQAGMHLFSQASGLLIHFSAKVIALTNPGVEPASLDPLYVSGVICGVVLLLLGTLSLVVFGLSKILSRLENKLGEKLLTKRLRRRINPQAEQES